MAGSSEELLLQQLQGKRSSPEPIESKPARSARVQKELASRLVVVLSLLISTIIESVAPQTPTPVQEKGQEDSTGFMNEVYYKSISNLFNDNDYPYSVGGGLPNIGLVYGAINSEYAQDNILETCFFQRNAGTPTMSGTCVFLLDITVGNYLFKRFDITYTGNTNTDKPQLTWVNSKDKTFTLLPHKKFYFLPSGTIPITDPTGFPNFIAAVCTEFVSPNTTLYLALIDSDTYNLLQDWFTGSKFFVLPNTTWKVSADSKLLSHHRDKHHYIWNPLDTTKPYKNSSQPSNSKAFAFKKGYVENGIAGNMVTLWCPYIDNHTTDFVFDLAVDRNYTYMLSLNNVSEVILCNFYAFIRDPSPDILIDQNATRTQGLNVNAKIGSYSDTLLNQFWHFAFFTRSLPSASRELAVVHHQDDRNKDDMGQVIKLHRFDETGLKSNSVVKLPTRPEVPTNIRLVNSGDYSPILNILHFIGDRLVYLDVWNFNNVPNNDDLADLKVWRLSATECDHAFSSVSAYADINTMTLSNFVPMICLKNNIVIQSVFTAMPAFTAILKFPNSVTTRSETIGSKVATSMDNNPSTFSKLTLKIIPWENYFSYMPTVSLASPTMKIIQNNYNIIPLFRETLVGASMLVTVDNPKVPGIFVLDNKQHYIRFNRTDVRFASTDSDQVWLNSIGGAYEDDNRRVGFMVCTEYGNYSSGTFERTCSETDKYTPSPLARIVSTVDLSKASCQAVFIQLEDKGGTRRTFLVYDNSVSALRFIGTLDGFDGYDMGCSGLDTVVVIGWHHNSAATPPSVLAFSLTTNAIISSPVTFPNFGLSKKFKIMGAALTVRTMGTTSSTLHFNMITYYPTPKLIVVQSLLYNETLQAFDDKSDYDYIFTDTWYNSNTRACFFTQSFILYDSTFADKTVRGFFGEKYGPIKKYYARVLFDLTQMGNFDLKEIFCHKLSEVNSFSVYGEKTAESPVDNFIYTTSVIATWEISDTPAPQKLYNLYTPLKKYIRIRVNDDGRRAIFFNLKEYYSTANYYRVQFEREQTLAYFNAPQGNYQLRLKISNTKQSQFLNIPIQVNKQQSIVVTPNSGLEYVVGQSLQLLTLPTSITSIASLATGPIFKIELLPYPGTYLPNVAWVSNRINLLSDNPPALRVATVTVTPSTVRAQKFPKGEVFYIAGDKTFYIYKDEKELAKCSATSNLVTSFRVALVDRSTVNRLYIIFQSADKLYATFLNLGTLKCSSTVITLKYTSLGAGSFTDITLGIGVQYLVSPLGMGTTSTNDFMLVILKPNANREYYYSTMQADGVTTINLSDAANSEPSQTPTTGTYVDCTVVNSPVQTTAMSLGVCLGAATSPGVGTDKLIAINLNPTATTPTTRTYTLTDSTNLKGFLALSCYIVTSSQLSCAADAGEGNFATFFLNKVIDPDPLIYAVQIGSIMNQLAAVPIESLQVSHTDGYTITAGRNKQGTFVLDSTVVIVYKRGLASQYAGVEIGNFPVASQIAFGFFCGSLNRFFAMDSKNMKLKVYNISEVNLQFNPSLLRDLNGILRFSNSMIGPQVVDIDLKTIFKPQIIVVIPPPPEPTPLWKIYWWIPLAVIAFLVAVYFARVQCVRIQEQNRIVKLKGEQVLLDLKDFHY